MPKINQNRIHKSTDLSIVIPTHNRHDSLMELLDSISYYRDQDITFDVIVVSNLKDSFVEDLKPRFLAKNLDIKVLSSGSLGVNRARNLGLKEACGSISLLLDDDCKIVNSQSFRKIINFHKRFPQAVAIGGVYKTDMKASAIDIAYNLLAGAWQSHSLYKDHESSRLVGGCVSYKTKKLLNCGELFDESICFGGAESEFHQRLNARGLQTLFFEDLHVQHKTRLNTCRLIYKAYCQARTSSQYNIDGGYEDVKLRTYQQKRELWALKEACDWKNFWDIIYFIKMYDLVYNMTFNALRLTKKFGNRF